MADSGIEAAGIVERIDSLRRDIGDRRETIEEFCQRCGLNATAISKWRGGEKISIYSLQKIVEANPGTSLDWLVFNRPANDQPYWIVERLASDVLDAVNRSLALVPEGKLLRLVRDEGPPPEPPGADPSEPD